MTARPPLLGLTLHRPWPALIRRGIKKIENRKWHPGSRLRAGEWFAVHAGLVYDDGCRTMAQRLGQWPAEVDRGDLATGAIVAVACYGGYVTESDDEWFVGPFGWILREVVAIDPVTCKGAQGLWRCPDDVADQVRAAFKLARAA